MPIIPINNKIFLPAFSTMAVHASVTITYNHLKESRKLSIMEIFKEKRLLGPNLCLVFI